MKFGFLISSIFLCITCYSQKTVIYNIQPSWGHNILKVIKSQNIKSDSTYFYKKKNNNKDSVLIMTQYFDSLGNLIERNEFGFNGEVFRITDYTYIDTMLVKEERISKEMFYINGSNLSKKIKTYDRDYFGNVITEKEYSFSGDSLKSMSLTQWSREYDSLGHLTKEFVTLPRAKTYLYHTYNYTNGNLTEIKTYNINQDWMYSYLYEYDILANTKTVYLYNNKNTLSHEFFYDETKLITEKDYEQGRGFSDHITQTYRYKLDGLLQSQTFIDLKGESYYYKHFYSK